MLSPGELTPSEGEIRTEREVGDETDVGGVNGTGKSARPFTKLRERAAPVPLVAITRGAPRHFSAKWDKRTGDPSAVAVLQDPITPSQPSSPRTASSKASNIHDVLRGPQCAVHESGTALTTCAPCSVPDDTAPTTSTPNLIPTAASLSTSAPYSIPPHTASASSVPYSIPAHAASTTVAPFSIPADAAGTTCAPYSVASGTASSMFGGSTHVPPYFAYQAHRAFTDAQLHHVTDIQWPYGALDGRPDPFMAPGPLLSNFPDQARDEPSEFDDEEEDDVEEDGSEDLDMEVFVEEECVWVNDGSVMEESVEGPRVSKEPLGTYFSSTGTDDMARTNAPLTQNTDNPSSVVALQCAARVQDSQVIDHSIPLGVLRSPDTTGDLGGSVRPESTRAATEGATAALVRQPFPEFVVRDTAGDVPLAEEQGFARAGDRHCAKVESDTGALVELSARSGAEEAAVVVEHAGSPIGAGGALLPEGVAASSDCAAPLEQCIASLQNGGSSGAGSVASHETRKSVGSYDVTPLESTWHPGSRGTMLPRNQDAHGAAMIQYHGDRALIDALSARLVGVEIEFRSKMALLEEKLMESLNVGAERANELRAMEREYSADKADADAVFQRELAERNIEYRSLVVELEAKHSKEVCELREALLLAQHGEATSKMKLDSERDFFEQDKAEQKRELENLHSKARVLQAERDLLQKQMREQSEQHQKDFQAYERELQKAATHLLSQARPDILPAATATVSSFQISSEFDTIGRAF